MAQPTTLAAAIKKIEDLEKELRIFKESPRVNTYLTIYNQLESFNQQLKIEDKRSGDGIAQKGFIDLFADKDAKEFDRVKWFFDRAIDLNKDLDTLRAQMTPDQQADLKAKEKLEGLSVAEKIALNGSGRKN